MKLLDGNQLNHKETGLNDSAALRVSAFLLGKEVDLTVAMFMEYK